MDSLNDAEEFYRILIAGVFGVPPSKLIMISSGMSDWYDKVWNQEIERRQENEKIEHQELWRA